MKNTKILHIDEPNYSLSHKTSLAIGCFDGVHLAHQEIIKNAIHKAQEKNASSAVITFDPHPKNFFSGQSHKTINTLGENIDIMKELGPDIIIVLKFNEQLSKLTAQEFTLFLSKNLNASYISTGCDFRFGKNRLGDNIFLRKASKSYSFQYQPIKRISIDSEDASSSNIKRLVGMRCLRRTKNLLGRYFFATKELSSYKILKFSEDLEIKAGFLQLEFEDKNPNNTIQMPDGVYYVSLDVSNAEEIGCFAQILNGKTSLYLFDMNFEQMIQQESLHKKKLFKIHFIDFIRPIRNLKNDEEIAYQFLIDKRAALYLKHHSCS